MASEGEQTAMSAYDKPSNNLINFVIGLSLLAFAAILLWFVFKIILGLAPLFGIGIMILGGILYLQADDEKAKLRALQTAFVGLIIMIVFGVIF